MSQKGKCLVVDDMSSMRKLVGKICTEMGYEVVDAKDGAEALEKLLAAPHSFTFVISDWTMPNFTGIQFLKAVRQDHRVQNMPFILLTAEGDAAQVKEAITAKVDAYIRKPFTAAIIQEKVAGVLAKKAAA